jgi:predicted metal-binding membrane protein
MSRSGSLQGQVLVVGGLLRVAGLAWFSTVARMAGMDAAPGTDLGTVGWFTVTWAVMMAAMMLPSLAPAAVSTAVGRVGVAGRTVLFAGGYLLVWTLAGVVLYGVLAVTSHAAGVAWSSGGRWLSVGMLILASAYELTPIKRAFLTLGNIGFRLRMVGELDYEIAAVAIGTLLLYGPDANLPGWAIAAILAPLLGGLGAAETTTAKRAQRDAPAPLDSAGRGTGTD